MLIPSVDIQGGECVQLIGGQERAIRAGDPESWVRRFSLVNEVAVIDLDGAMGKGSNAVMIKALAKKYAIRVGGGIRDVDTALEWLNLGVRKVIIGTAASPELLRRLPRSRVVVALDVRQGEIQVEGWTVGTGRSLPAEIRRFAPFASEFLVTNIEREGRMCGLDMNEMRTLVSCYPDVKFTMAGGAFENAEISAADAMGVDIQVGMAIYSGRLSESGILSDILKSRSKQEIWPTVVVDESGMALGLVYSNAESLEQALTSGKGVYWSRQRGLWKKGEQSGNTQELRRVSLGCNRDSLQFVVKQSGSGFCHTGTWNCFDMSADFAGFQVAKTSIEASLQSQDCGSYSRYLTHFPHELNKKIQEEAEELVTTSPASPEEVLHEFCDLFYFSYLKLRAAGLSWSDAEKTMLRRSLKVSRRFHRDQEGSTRCSN